MTLFIENIVTKKENYPYFFVRKDGGKMDYSVQNSLNRAAGQNFENIIADALEYYESKGFCSIQKTPEPMKTLKQNSDKKTFIAVYTEKAQPDYKGVLLGGQTIIFDAKYTSTEKIMQSAVTKKQEEIFEKYQKLGAQCFVMVSMSGTDFYRIPWDNWKGMKESYGHKYMTKKESEKFRIKMKQVLLLLEGIELNEYS